MNLGELKAYFMNEIANKYSEQERKVLFEIFGENKLGLNSFQQRQEMQLEITSDQISDFKTAISRLKMGQPYQQILGETEFYGSKFFVDEHVLIPRPETEELLELAIAKIQDARLKRQDSSCKILDIGTGSGIIPIVLKKYFPKAQVSALDFSKDALKTAQRNADFHEVEINFIHQDYLNENLTEVYDVIISNPPYIGIEEESEIADSVKEFEPKMALFSPTSNALIFYEKIAEDCKSHLAENGLVFLEINQKLGKETLELFTDVLKEAELIKDLSGNERFVWGRK
ncbi:peptide chain release factor N(5)-glutamine methyltransferase [Kaistella polysaccharea]|uniref:peptide chain release factor N(5)-glutamine methyltransferase n=1 Tax=Kaistella polysaccharea TaxID=2878534 RepID=UPI001CF15DE9|nr:peptide chain release factor N(5)-glutamine methyltransferase [Kaistella polysaccharea]